MNQVIVYAPLHFQGLGFPSQYVSQGIAHIGALLDAPPQEGIPGSLLTCLAEDLKWEIGPPGYFLQQDYRRFEKATAQCWRMSTWEFIHIGQIQIKNPLPDLPLGRINNEHLMEIFTREGVTSKLLRRLNQR